jgi:hypothetical protein
MKPERPKYEGILIIVVPLTILAWVGAIGLVVYHLVV